MPSTTACTKPSWCKPTSPIASSETKQDAKPLFISCAAGANAFTDILAERVGSLLRITGHPIVDLAPNEARTLAHYILEHFHD